MLLIIIDQLKVVALSLILLLSFLVISHFYHLAIALFSKHMSLIDLRHVFRAHFRGFLRDIVKIPTNLFELVFQLPILVLSLVLSMVDGFTQKKLSDYRYGFHYFLSSEQYFKAYSLILSIGSSVLVMNNPAKHKFCIILMSLIVSYLYQRRIASL